MCLNRGSVPSGTTRDWFTPSANDDDALPSATGNSDDDDAPPSATGNSGNDDAPASATGNSSDVPPSATGNIPANQQSAEGEGGALVPATGNARPAISLSNPLPKRIWPRAIPPQAKIH